MQKAKNPAAVSGRAFSVDKLGGSVSGKPTPPQRQIPDDAHSICIGRLHYGWIIDRGGGRWEAIKADHVSLGLYNDHGAATSALLMTNGAV